MQDSPFIATVLFGPDGPRSKAVEDDKPLSADGPRSVRPRSHNEALQKNECTVETASVSAASCRDEEAWSANLITAVWRRLFRRPVSTWYPTFWQIHPLSGLAALAVTAGCIVAALLILINSDGQPTEDWPVQPTVYLAVVTAIANAGLAFAHFEAIPVSWWWSVSRGRTIGSLERQWHVSRSFVQAIIYGRHFSLLSLACIAGTLVIIDGPLLQRASSVASASKTEIVTLDLAIPAELPRGFSGNVSYWQTDSDRYVEDIGYDMLSQRPIPLPNTGCNGTCEVTIQGPGVARQNCSTTTWNLTPDILRSMNSTWGIWKDIVYGTGAPVVRLPAFSVVVDRSSITKDRDAVRLEVGFVAWDRTYHGKYTYRSCELVPAILEYDVEVEAEAMRLPRKAGQGKVLQLANNTTPVDFHDVSLLQATTLQGLVPWVSISNSANVSVDLSANRSPEMTYAMEMLSLSPGSLKHLKPGWNIGAIPVIAFEDPTHGVVHDLNEMMLRGAAVAGSWENLRELVDPETAVRQKRRAVQTNTQTVFRSDLSWFLGAAAIQMVTIVLILPMFWGWWTLGCNLTMSPFTTALMFDAPIFGDANSATGARGVVEELGSVRVRLGIVDSADAEIEPGKEYTTGRLGVDRYQNVIEPQGRVRFLR